MTTQTEKSKRSSQAPSRTEEEKAQAKVQAEILNRLEQIERTVLKGYEETRRLRRYTTYALAWFILRRHGVFYLYCGLCFFIAGNAAMLKSSITEARYYLRDLNQFRRDCANQPLRCFTGEVSPPAFPSLIGAGSVVSVTPTATGSALEATLSTIAWAEGTHERYDIMFGGGQFTSFADHPRVDIPINDGTGRTSDAAGRYQFLSTTWDVLAEDLNLADFSPANQDKAAIALLQECNGYGAAMRGDMTAVANNCWRVWASLEGEDGGKLDPLQGSYAPSTLQATFNERYKGNQ